MPHNRRRLKTCGYLGAKASEAICHGESFFGALTSESICRCEVSFGALASEAICHGEGFFVAVASEATCHGEGFFVAVASEAISLFDFLPFQGRTKEGFPLSFPPLSRKVKRGVSTGGNLTPTLS